MYPTAEDPTIVTDEQRTYLIDLLTTGTNSVRAATANLTDSQLAYKSSPDRWSIAEIIEHIVLVESALFQGIQKGLGYPDNLEKRAEIRVSDLDIIKAVKSRNVTLPAPDPVMPAGKFVSVSAALSSFEQERKANLTLIENATENLRTHFARHPAFGWIDTYQALLVLALHPVRHIKQIDEVKTSAGFPA